MPADLKAPFAESCCDGGAYGLDDKSTQPCGCDKGAGWVCERHREDAMRNTEPAMGWAERKLVNTPYATGCGWDHVPVRTSTEVRIKDPISGGEKGQKLARYDLMPPDALWELALVYGMGARKYADRNWEKGYKWGLSVGALERHLARWKMGQSRDDEVPLDGAHHLAQVMWHAAALLVFELRKIGTDDVRVHTKPPKI